MTDDADRRADARERQRRHRDNARGGRVVLPIGVDRAELVAHLKAFGMLKPGERPTHRQLAEMLEWLVSRLILPSRCDLDEVPLPEDTPAHDQSTHPEGPDDSLPE